MKMKFRVQGSQQKFDHLRQTAYCIQFSKQHIAQKKKQSFLNKLSFDYSLQKVNQQKMYGRIIPLSSQLYPATQSRGNKYCHHLYSSDRVRMKKDVYSTRYKQIPQHKQQIKRYKHIISKKKNQQQGGIDSFWIFKKDPIQSVKQKLKEKQRRQLNQQQNLAIQLKNTTQAFFNILKYANQPLDTENAIIPRNVFKSYVSSNFGQTFCLWFINFYQIKTYVNFRDFQILVDRFRNINLRQCHLVSFFIYDDNGDGFLCPRDIFSIFQRQFNDKIDKDILKIGNFIKNNLGRKDVVKEEFKIQRICIRDDWLTVKDYQLYYRKVDQPFLKAKNKKDTVFSKSFAVLDHRQNVRSKRRQMNEKTTYFDQLYGQITNVKANHPYIDLQDDYKLNYSLFHQIFGKQSTQAFKYFISFLFGIKNKISL